MYVTIVALLLLYSHTAHGKGIKACTLTNENRTLSQLEGTIVALPREHNEECEWTFVNQPPTNNYLLTITVVDIDCSGRRLKIGGTQDCHDRPYIKTFKNEDATCTEVSEPLADFPPTITYKFNQDGFTINYAFTDCDATTESATSTTLSTAATESATSTTPSTAATGSTKPLTETTKPGAATKIVTKETGPTTGINTNTSKPTAETNPTSKKETPTSAPGTGASDQAANLLTIFIPLIVILVILLVVLVVIMHLRSKNIDIFKMMRKQSKPDNDQLNPAYEEVGELPHPANNAFGNPNYETVLGGPSQPDNAYATINDGAVYYSPVAGGASGSGSNTGRVNYDDVAPDETGGAGSNPASHNYDEVTLDSDGCKEPEKEGPVEVDNILYGDAPGPSNRGDPESPGGVEVANVLYGQTPVTEF